MKTPKFISTVLCGIALCALTACDGLVYINKDLTAQQRAALAPVLEEAFSGDSIQMEVSGDLLGMTALNLEEDSDTYIWEKDKPNASPLRKISIMYSGLDNQGKLGFTVDYEGEKYVEGKHIRSIYGSAHATLFIASVDKVKCELQTVILNVEGAPFNAIGLRADGSAYINKVFPSIANPDLTPVKVKTSLSSQLIRAISKEMQNSGFCRKN